MRLVVRRLNDKAPSKGSTKYFLLGKRERGIWVGYCLAVGDVSKPTTWVINLVPANLIEMAAQWGVRLSPSEEVALKSK